MGYSDHINFHLVSKAFQTLYELLHPISCRLDSVYLHCCHTGNFSPFFSPRSFREALSTPLFFLSPKLHSQSGWSQEDPLQMPFRTIFGCSCPQDDPPMTWHPVLFHLFGLEEAIPGIYQIIPQLSYRTNWLSRRKSLILWQRENVEEKINKNISTHILKPLLRFAHAIDIGWISFWLICKNNCLDSVKGNRWKCCVLWYPEGQMDDLMIQSGLKIYIRGDLTW